MGSGSAEPPVGPLSADAVSCANLLPGRSGGMSLIGHPVDPPLGLGASFSGSGEGTESELSEVVATQVVDGATPSGISDDGFHGRADGVHASRVDRGGPGCQEMMTPEDHYITYRWARPDLFRADCSCEWVRASYDRDAVEAAVDEHERETDDGIDWAEVARDDREQQDQDARHAAPTRKEARA